jgi:hypothetical protein
MVNLVAAKALTYKTRRLQADDLFEARPRDARLLVAIGKAREAAAGETPAAKPVPAPAGDGRPALRAEYERVLGKKPFGGWDAATLREKIAAAQNEG